MERATVANVTTVVLGEVSSAEAYLEEQLACEALKADYRRLEAELRKTSPVLVTPRSKRDIRYGATSLRPERAPLGSYLALTGGAVLWLSASRVSLERVDLRVLTVLAALAASLGLLSWLRRRHLGVAWVLVGSVALALWLVEVAARSTSLAKTEENALVAAVSSLGSGMWLMLVGGALVAVSAMAGLPWRSTSPRRRTSAQTAPSSLGWTPPAFAMRAVEADAMPR